MSKDWWKFRDHVRAVHGTVDSLYADQVRINREGTMVLQALSRM